jgi:hypothetical protein
MVVSAAEDPNPTEASNATGPVGRGGCCGSLFKRDASA